MSKLFDQLKDAARSREEKSPGLLADALKRQQEAAPQAVSAAPSPESVAVAAPNRSPSPPPSGTRISSYSGVGLAVLIFTVAVLAWRATPWIPPRMLKIDPSELRLDRTLDLQRPGAERPASKGTSSPGQPS